MIDVTDGSDIDVGLGAVEVDSEPTGKGEAEEVSIVGGGGGLYRGPRTKQGSRGCGSTRKHGWIFLGSLVLWIG